MARETVAQRNARFDAERDARVTVARATYVERMMAVLERAVKQNFELTVKDSKFYVEDRDDRRASNYSLTPAWNELADSDLYTLELSVELKEEEAAEQKRVYELRKAAFNKLTKEEQQALGLTSEFNW